MAWASRMATMAALLTATSGVVLVNDWKLGTDCCISRNADKKVEIEAVPLLGCNSIMYGGMGSSWVQKDSETCAAVKNNKKTYLDLRKCMRKYWKAANGKPETEEPAKFEEVVFSGILTIEKNPTEMADCVELFKRAYTAQGNDVAKAAYQKLRIEAVIDATTRMPDLLKELVEILEMKGHSNDSHIVKSKVYVDKLVSNLKETMGEGDKANIGYKSETDTENKNVESPNTIGSPGPQSGAKIVSGNTESPTTKKGADQQGANIVSGNPEVKQITGSSDNNGVVKTPEAVEPPKSKWHACIHKINTLLGIAKKTFVRAMRHQLRAQQE